jgi:hypothetical protein
MSPNRKSVADEASEADRRAVEADPEADLARGHDRPRTPERERAEHPGSVVIEDVDPNEVDPGHPPRSPI